MMHHLLDIFSYASPQILPAKNSGTPLRYSHLAGEVMEDHGSEAGLQSPSLGAIPLIGG